MKQNNISILIILLIFIFSFKQFECYQLPRSVDKKSSIISAISNRDYPVEPPPKSPSEKVISSSVFLFLYYRM